MGVQLPGIMIILMPLENCRLRPDFNGTIKIDVPIFIAGAFAFYTSFSPLPLLSAPGSTTDSATRTATYYIDVAPLLTVNGSDLPINSLSIFSVISKFMGEYPQNWEKHLQGIKSRDYNMVHFTPLSERGGSNSPYSIRDQLHFDPVCFPHGEDDVINLIDSMEGKHELLGLTDVVWNHTSYDSKWLEVHPEAGYSVETAPWLESALELDNALLAYGSNLPNFGLPTVLTGLDDLKRVVEGVKTIVINEIKLWEYYVINVGRDAKAIVEAWSLGNIIFPAGGFGSTEIGRLEGAKDWSIERQARFLHDNGIQGASELGPRFHRKVDPCVGAALLTVVYGYYDAKNKTPDWKAPLENLKLVLDKVNVAFYQEYNKDAETIMQQISDRLKYLRLDEHGPKLGAINSESTIIESYFTRLPSNPETQKHKSTSLALVNNGWIWNADAMKDHAGPDSRAYLRREVIVWCDCVKLRYGNSPTDNPFLWDFMTRYTKLMAKYFAGFRIDNCHSTPLVVAEYLLDKAREVRPNLVVFAELFTGSEEMDYVFVKRLGFSALIREAMQAWSAAELSRLVHMHGGRPIGSFEVDEIASLKPVNHPTSDIQSPNGKIGGKKETVHRIRRSPVHALFMDCTHDNKLPAEKRTAPDTLPNTALVNMCACATGSVFGYDEIYPKYVDIVNEKRLYSSPYSGLDEKKVARRSGPGGIGGIKKLLNQFHTLAGRDGYDETHIHHEGQYITIHRVHPKTRKGCFVIAHTAFPGSAADDVIIAPVQLIGSKASLVGSWKLEVETNDTAIDASIGETTFLKGLPSLVSDISGIGLDIQHDRTVITAPDEFPPGSIAIFETWIPGAEHSEGLDEFISNGASKAFGQSSLVDMNFILYRSEPEERDSSGGRDGVYDIPGYGPLVYAGLQGWWSVLKNIVRNNDLGHPLCNHLREGQWALDYIVGRLERISRREGYTSLEAPARWLAERFDAIRKLPNFLLPRYFALTIQTAYRAAWERCISLMNDDVQHGQSFLQSLAMTGVQLAGPVGSASLSSSSVVSSLAAGLPHFSTGWARCWGRDIFIALRGLFLATGRHEVAKDHIRAFASVMKHGMIPNLLSNGDHPRYNARDAVWFFLQSIQDYSNMVPSGTSILQETVARRFLPYDDTYFEPDDPRAYSKESTIEEIIQEALQRHASGLSFREANAGPGLDCQMKYEGFQIEVKVDWSTGLVFGGSQFNCGTWMDKMGESEKAANKGVPATPRDGAAIEITGLAYSTLAWVTQLHKDGQYRHSGVKTKGGQSISFADWASRIKSNFERCYYVPLDPKEDTDYDINTAIVNRRGIYKDLYKSGKDYEDYQLRPNFPIAMTVAPDLFTPSKALHALEVADMVLRGPTGMATLDPSDLQYRPYYNNSEDSTDFATAKGRNYHQGPEWLWPTGFFLRALLKFDLMRRNSQEARTEAFQQVTRRLEGCKKAIEESPWAGLVELTNKNGEPCGDTVSVLMDH